MHDGRVKHGLGGRYNRAPEFGVWCKMRQRCSDTKSPDYANYGGRGITVCERWQDFASFMADMGARPSPLHTIERVDNDAGYAPSNCVWASRLEQNRNRRPRAVMTECRRGHPLDEVNTYFRPDGKRGCKTCRTNNMKAFYERKKESAQ